VNKGKKMNKTTLNKQTRKHWFEWACFTATPIMNKHHVVPRHHGGSDDTSNMTPPLTLMEHAKMHLDIHHNGIDGIGGTKGCKKCLQSYKTLRGQHLAWIAKTKLYEGKNAELDFYKYENPEPNVLDGVVEITVGDSKEPLDAWDEPQSIQYESGVYENREFNETDSMVMEDSMSNVIDYCLYSIPERERTIIKMIFGLGEYNNVYHTGSRFDGIKLDGMTITEIAEIFQVTNGRIRDLLHRGIQRLKQPSRSNNLRSFL
jgi:RNA polymerase sigma factor (sigma-70 family)